MLCIDGLPREIFSGEWPYGHCQGIAVDVDRGFACFSFTTALIKTDLQGNVIGTVTGLLGHLGCIGLCPADGRVYGSLEYKNDVIGRGILERAGVSGSVPDGFYVAIFDVDRICRVGMDACADGVMTAVWLKEVVQDYSARVENNGKTPLHCHGCSGIDGLTFGKIPGSDLWRLFVAYGIYSDPDRTDNDCQVLLCYDPTDWKRYERPLHQNAMHQSGPEKPEHKFFVHTGNTTYGVQNLEYDPATGNFWMAVYRGKKPGFPNYDFYVIDGSKAPVKGLIPGVEPVMDGELLTLLSNGRDEAFPGWHYPWGSTGICALGDGYCYISHDGGNPGSWYSRGVLCQWDGTPFRENLETNEGGSHE